MKKSIMTVCLAGVLGFSSLAMAAGFNGGGSQQYYSGFNGGNQAISTVAQAKQMPDDSWVTLQGNIIKQIGKEDYVFKDNTGEINVEIDDRDWRGITVSPQDTVIITGEVDTHRFKATDIDVKNIQIVSPTTK